ncbi:MAG: hypothetical protein COB51_09390 [Moraxellaceae bacterium]|nr:MAG: hypothetical protein COB51_09390 [Moraxellaceae bacterium]
MSFMDMILGTFIFAGILAVISLVINRKAIPNINSDKDVVSILLSGDNLKALRAYRQLHGVGLKEAKEFVENYNSNLSNKDVVDGR